MGRERPGGFEELVLMAVASLDGDGYGASLQGLLEDAVGKTVSVGAVYAALDRLERKGLITSRVGGATRERGGRRKRLFSIDRAGREALREMHRIRASLSKLIADRSEA